MLKASLGALLIRVAGAFSIFAMNYIVSRSLDAREAGYFFWGLSGLFIFAQLAAMGFNDVLLKHISRSIGEGRPEEASALSAYVLKRVVGASCLLAFAIYVSADYAALFVFGGENSASASIRALSPALVFWTVAVLFAHKLQGAGFPLRAIFVLSIGPYFFLSAFLLLFEVGSAVRVSFYFSCSTLINLLVAIYWWFSKFKYSSGDSCESGELWKMALSMWSIALMSVSISWSGQFIAGLWAESGDVAHYSIAVRVSALLNFYLVAINFVVAPKFARLKVEDVHAIQTVLSDALKILYVLAIPSVVVVATFSKQILGVFGGDYGDASNLLLILLIGQLVNVLTGPVGYVLTMTGNEASMRNLYIASGFLGVFLTLILSNKYGILGTAIAASVSLGVHNLGVALIVWLRLHVVATPVFLGKRGR